MMMNENEINALIEQKVQSFQECEKFIEKIQYIMDFGEITVQYDFCLN